MYSRMAAECMHIRNCVIGNGPNVRVQVSTRHPLKGDLYIDMRRSRGRDNGCRLAFDRELYTSVHVESECKTMCMSRISKRSRKEKKVRRVRLRLDTGHLI